MSEYLIVKWVHVMSSTVLFLSGFYLVHLAQLSPWSPWLAWSIVLYVLALACWVPVVRLQILMSRMASSAAARDDDLPACFWRYHRVWTLLGAVAFVAFVAIFYLMTVKPLF